MRTALRSKTQKLGGDMAKAKELLLTFLSASPEYAGSLFAEDGLLEVPYLASIGVEPRYRGPATICAFLRVLHGDVYPGAVFENVAIHMETPNQAFGEYHLTARSAISGRTVHQQFFGHLVVQSGKIQSLTEAIDTVAAAEAMWLGGLAQVVMQGDKHHGPLL